jgi:hypothetical protein
LDEKTLEKFLNYSNLSVRYGTCVKAGREMIFIGQFRKEGITVGKSIFASSLPSEKFIMK